MNLNHIYTGNAATVLQTLPKESIDCVVTSPPYYGLRDYGTAQWQGGDPACKHSTREEKGFEKWKQSSNRGNSKPPKSICPKCGAVRVDNQIGLEDTPEEYINRLTAVFNEIRRVLKPTGTLWLNIGDSYACKSLIGIPWQLAFALRNAGWYLRQDIIWHKPNPMPESVRDRCTKAHEYIFLLSKSKKYYFNHEAMLEPANYDGRKKILKGVSLKYCNNAAGIPTQSIAKGGGLRWANTVKGCPARNKRDVWLIPTRPFKEAHFATFPPELASHCIKAGCPENGVVLDPFFGAGTTGVVAKQLNRNYIGIELNENYVEIAERRIKKA